MDFILGKKMISSPRIAKVYWCSKAVKGLLPSLSLAGFENSGRK